jgi:hypothetical protein
MFFKYYNLCENVLEELLVLEANSFLAPDFKQNLLNKIITIEKQKLPSTEKKRSYMEVKKELFAHLIRINYKNINKFFTTDEAGKKTLTPNNAKKLDFFLESILRKLKEENYKFTKITRGYMSSYKG